MTITTLDEKLARLLEPRAPRPALRLEAVRKLSEAGIPVGVFPNPIMPVITDGERRSTGWRSGARRRARYLRRRPAVPDAVRAEGLLSVSGAGFSELLPRYRELFARRLSGPGI